jgi:hypothetical protein
MKVKEIHVCDLLERITKEKEKGIKIKIVSILLFFSSGSSFPSKNLRDFVISSSFLTSTKRLHLSRKPASTLMSRVKSETSKCPRSRESHCRIG